MKNNKKIKAYLASPFFNEGEIERMANVLKILREKGLEVFAPYENQNKHLEFGTKEWRKATFEGDLKGIYDCDVMVAIISQGNYSDSGTAAECMAAYILEKDLVVVNLSDKEVNLMIADSLDAYISSYEELKAYDFDKMPKIPYDNYVW